ncbi:MULTISPECIES: lysophospholipid acyltransferase family protein [unclassified Bradyrhizobium]|uniref:lysophospholipid acyltransferase family protein n=1 Tax=unclassified Bradyrhizobium TaxID=2631580 RepID=UPI001FF78C06|nr:MULTISPECIES: lysophospholipid acyltransferase family protein [unclassified Bradyrhizobium]MCK1708900.1 1-acyl-sn-glycerol-3-phosphate acyltransferase [Bradyrhizobium sp. 143]MCK1726985.1 1-acyl-sn-glycerol-3-phosphate acyltransferase [Bradyrhizobium sp. 142]
MLLIFLRSLVFNVLFYAVLVGLAIVALPTFLMPARALLTVAGWWAKASIFLMRVICNIKVEVRGAEKIPEGPLLVVAKHQSFWETFALMPFFNRPIFILKRQLMHIPVFGQFLRKIEMIAINRSAGVKALLDMTRRARAAVRSGRQLLIFPEGTRRPPGAPPDYKTGFAQIYSACGVQCLPIALNSGLFWPRRTFMRYPGTLVVEFLDPLPPGLPKDEFIARVRDVIEDATGRIVEAGRKEQERLIGSAPSYVASGG